MGTETLASPRRSPGDVRQKVLNYQHYFRLGAYNRYEQTWRRSLNGFRLLFLTNSVGRMRDLGRVVSDTPPSDFLWITDQAQMFDEAMRVDLGAIKFDVAVLSGWRFAVIGDGSGRPCRTTEYKKKDLGGDVGRAI